MSQDKNKKAGFLMGLQANLERNRLGELLVSNGTITTEQLLSALRIQKQTGFALGTVLKEQGLITGTGLKATLMQQMAWRAMAASIAFVIGFSALGIHSARATSASLEGVTTSRKSVPEDGLQKVSLNRASPGSAVRTYEPLFGASETRSADISPFTKWTGIMARLKAGTAAQHAVAESKPLEA
ncbi:MAG: hypothetical protein EBR02_10495, partial [Alphaproteobacteria bacterium]|nr:hypothetical protein [Alphaproteobacteria bacterium]